MDTEGEVTRLFRELQANRLKEQIHESKALQLSARLPEVAVTCVLSCAGIAMAVILFAAVRRIMM